MLDVVAALVKQMIAQFISGGKQDVKLSCFIQHDN